MATTHKQKLSAYLARHKNETTESTESRNVNRPSHPAISASRRSTNESACARSNASPASSSNSLGSKSNISHPKRCVPPQVHIVNWAEDLPDEMLLKIFSYLDVVGVLHASLVCKRWSALSKDDSLWRRLTQQYAAEDKKAGKVPESSRNDASFDTQWKNACIARCAKWRNQRAMKMMKRNRIDPYTGLNSDTEKVLKELGITYQLSLVDSYGKEHTVESSRPTLHRSSASVFWHSLSFLPVGQVRRLRVLAICPLFYNHKGKVVAGSPYQRALLWESEIRVSKWLAENQPLAGDEHVNVYKLPGDLLMGTWKADGEIAFMAAGLHTHELVQRCVLATPTEPYVPAPHQVIPDDIDSTYGLHDYCVTFELRTFQKVLCSHQVSTQHCSSPEDLRNGVAPLEMKFTAGLEKRPCLPWRTELFKGTIENVAWLDLTVIDERNDVFFVASSPVTVQAPGVETADFEHDTGRDKRVIYEGDKLTLQIEISQDSGREFVHSLQVLIKTSAINKWFGTKYPT